MCTLELEPRDLLDVFLTFWPFEPHFLLNFFLIRKNVYVLLFPFHFYDILGGETLHTTGDVF